MYYPKMSLDNKRALKVFWGLVQFQAKSAFSGLFRVPDKHYCLINLEMSLDNLNTFFNANQEHTQDLVYI